MNEFDVLEGQEKDGRTRRRNVGDLLFIFFWFFDLLTEEGARRMIFFSFVGHETFRHFILVLDIATPRSQQLANPVQWPLN